CRAAGSFTSVPSLTVRLGYLVTSRAYQASSARSFSLKEGAAAAWNTPPRRSLFSYSVTLWPRRAQARADSIPPMPPPMTAISLGAAAGVSRYLRDCIVVGLRAQRAMPRVSPKDWALAWPL